MTVNRQARMRIRIGARRQFGQAMVEVCVACIALVPLVIGLVYVGQYIHIKQTTQMAAREAAWDAAVAPSTYKVGAPDAGTEQARLQARYFADANAAIQPDAPAPDSFVDPVLLDYSGQQLLTPEHFTLTVYKNEGSPGPEGTYAGIVAGITGAAAEIFSDTGLNSSGGAFPPDPEGYITAEVHSVTTKARYFRPFDTLDIDLHSKTVLLADAWDADGGGENYETGEFDANGAPIPQRTVRSVVTPLAPTTELLGGPVGDFLRIVGVISKIPIVGDFFPGLDEFQPGRTSPDVVPYDKLKPYNGK